MSQSGPAPVIAQDYLQVDPFKAPTKPRNENEVLAAGASDPAFAYAMQQFNGLLPPDWVGDNATIDAIWAIAKAYKTPPASPTLTSLAPNTAVNNSPAFVMTLTGTGFTAGSSVLFGTVTETRILFVSATSLQMVVYPGYIPAAGTIQVSVKPGGGAAASAQIAFTVT
jgi:hypothetical protein